MAVLSIPRPAAANVPPLVAGLAVLVAGAMLLPLAYLLVRVLGNTEVFVETVTRDTTVGTVTRTAWLAAAVTASAVAIAVPAAWLTTRTDLPLRKVWSVLMILPLVFPSYVGAYVLVSALGPRGMVRDILAPLGVERLPDIYGFTGAWLALTLFTFPYVLLPVRAAMMRMDRSLEEAARSLGKSPVVTFFRVTIPQLRPAIAAGGLLVALYTLSDFGAVSILHFDSLTRVIFIQYKSSFDRTGAASLALLLVGIAFLIVALEAATRGSARYHTSARHKAPLTRLGGWRWPALAFCSTVTFFSLIMPLAVIVFWLTRGVDAGAWTWVRPAAVNSVSVSALAALAAVAAALPVAVLSVRHPGWFSRLLEKATYSGFALPGITIALALVFFGANYAPFLYQTVWLLIFAYVVRFLPQALGATRTSLLQTNPSTEEAARSLGHGGLTVFRRVTLPQILPGVSAGGLLVFLTAMKELPATLLLSPIGFKTLATEIWASTTEAMFARAALPALILLALSAIPMMMIVLREQKEPHD